MVNIISAFCLAIMLLLVGTTVVKLIVLDRREKIKYLKNFKMGQFALIYPVAIPLYWMAAIEGGQKVFEGFLSAIESTLDLVVLSYNYDGVSALTESNVLFQSAIIACYILVTINALIFAFSFLGQRVVNFFRITAVRLFSKRINIIVGYDDNSEEIVQSVSKGDGDVLVFAEALDERLRDDMSVYGRACVKVSFNKDIGEQIKKLFGNLSRRQINIIVNTADDASDLILVKQLSDLLLSQGLTVGAYDEDKGVNVFVFGEPENESAFVHFVEKTKGRVHYINKYKLIAMNFTEKYPMTAFMDAKHLDYDTATVRAETDINAVFIGFGKTNRQVFLTSVANNQFLTLDKSGNLIDKAVNYYIFDKNKPNEEKNLQHNYFRYDREKMSLKNSNDYLPLPADPAFVTFPKEGVDINGEEFIKLVRAAVLPQEKGHIPYNYIVIGFGTDMENIDMASKMRVKVEEWGVLNDTKIFVKIRDAKLCNKVVKEEIFTDGAIIPFGVEAEVAYDYNQIIAEKMEKMAKMRHLAYAIEYAETHKKEDEKLSVNDLKAQAKEEWFQSWRQIQRESNIYACLSIRMKLHLLGYDYVVGKGDEKATQEFIAKYTARNPVDYEEKEVNGKKVVRYTNATLEIPSLRYTYAVQEHQRWNSYMITGGFIPSSKTEIKAGNKGKNFAVRKHGNLTTFAGLKEFRKIVAETYGKTEEEADVIRYDYQLMDDLVWLLSTNGYGIVKK